MFLLVHCRADVNLFMTSALSLSAEINHAVLRYLCYFLLFRTSLCLTEYPFMTATSETELTVLMSALGCFCLIPRFSSVLPSVSTWLSVAIHTHIDAHTALHQHSAHNLPAAAAEHRHLLSSNERRVERIC